MEYEKVLNLESISVIGALMFFIYYLINERNQLKKEIREDKKEIKVDHDSEIKKLDERSEQLLKEIADLHEEKYRVTREVIPLLIKLIDKLNNE